MNVQRKKKNNPGDPVDTAYWIVVVLIILIVLSCIGGGFWTLWLLTKAVTC